MTTPRFGRLLTAMVTPFQADGSINFDVAIELATYLVGEGCDGLVIAGSTGEGSSLSDKEKLELFACVAGAVEVPVLAGSTFADTARSVDLTRQVLETGVSGVLATTPAYARPSQKGIAAHFAAIANATELPIMLYDIPIRTGRKIAASTVIDLVSSHSNIVAIKDASGDLVSAAHYKSVLGDDIDLYSGDDSVILPFMGVGAVGLVSVAAHWAAREFVGLIDSAVRGDWTQARAFNERLATSYAFETSDLYPNPMPSKAALRYLGFDVGQCRLPHAESDDTLDADAAKVVAALQASRG
ncbi:MAG TPA: 4-hydroxy-tetrahydrodipicolinate synthase [Acidimicrobiales bacterium]